MSHFEWNCEVPVRVDAADIRNGLATDKTERGRRLRESLRVYITRTVGTPSPA
jgi:hypothetical protein